MVTLKKIKQPTISSILLQATNVVDRFFVPADPSRAGSVTNAPLAGVQKSPPAVLQRPNKTPDYYGYGHGGRPSTAAH